MSVFAGRKEVRMLSRTMHLNHVSNKEDIIVLGSVFNNLFEHIYYTKYCNITVSTQPQRSANSTHRSLREWLQETRSIVLGNSVSLSGDVFIKKTRWKQM